MRKKVMAAVLTAAMVASVSAMPQMVAAADDEFKIGLITDVGGVNDGSFNQSAWEGLEKAGEELGVEVNYLESATDADYQPNMETFVDEDYDLIISVGYMLADATREAAEANPDTKFAIIDDSSIDLPNVTSLMFKAEQASYLVGYVAGLTTKTNNIGFVVGMTNETMNQFGYGYCAGAIDANPDITVQQFNANSFADSATGKTMANTAITNGADIVFQAAGATGLGVIEACQEAGVYAIGVDSDQSGIIGEDITVTSAMKGLAPTVKTALDAIKDGNWESDYAGKIDNLGLVSEKPEDNYVQLPMETTQWDDNFTVDDYKDLVKKLYNGEIEVSSDITAMPETEITVNDYGSIK